MKRGTLYIVAAPSGAGKSSIVNAVLARDAEIALSISFTSRGARPGERHAQHYHFISAEEFDRLPKTRSFQSIALTAPSVNSGEVEGGFQVNGASGAENGFTYVARVDGPRPVSDYTARVVAYHPEASVPLEAAEILWQR